MELSKLTFETVRGRVDHSAEVKLCDVSVQQRLGSSDVG
jgi:hypothetical protein